MPGSGKRGGSAAAWTGVSEKTLVKLPQPPPNIALVGNYLGRIGLAKIFERAAFVVENIVKRWD